MYRKVLCPIDFSAGSQQALRTAVRLANDANAELVLAHSWYVPPLAFAGEMPYAAGLIDDMVGEEQKALAAALHDAKELGATKVSSLFLSGRPADQICDTLTRDPAYDLVVMGTHGRTGLGRIIMGSIAEKVIRHAPCSVMAVRGRNGTNVFRHILCPVDLSPGSRAALDAAATLAARDGLGITLLHVLELPVAFVGEPASAGVAADLDREAARVLAEWAGSLRKRVTVPVTTRTRVGSPAAQALTVLEAEKTFDLVIVGSHEHSALGRLVIGSVAEKIVRHSPCPVLVARPRHDSPAPRTGT